MGIWDTTTTTTYKQIYSKSWHLTALCATIPLGGEERITCIIDFFFIFDDFATLTMNWKKQVLRQEAVLAVQLEAAMKLYL